jgi:3-phosphoshikimate 1-carboxyvinyltransferase
MIRVPGSKSYTNRALIMAALTKGPVSLLSPLYSDDTEAMIRCLSALGIAIERESDKIIVHGDVASIAEGTYHLYAADSGTTVRFLLPLLCITPGIKTLAGSPRMNERPIKDLVDALRELGAEIEYGEKKGQLPVKVTSSSLSGDHVRIKSDLSSQFCSGLLLIAPYFREGLTIEIVGSLISKSYVDMTVRCMRDWGVVVTGNYQIPPGQKYTKEQYLIEGDYSSAAYFFALAALTQSTIVVENLEPASSQADRRFLSILETMGNVVTCVGKGIRIEGKQVAPLGVDMEDCPDQVMTLAVLAAFAPGVTRITGVRSLRLKETERVVAIKTELQKMGIRTEDTHDTLTIYGGDPKPAVIETYNDHRIAMAFGIARVRLPEMKILHPEVVSKTFPTFWTLLHELTQ